VSERRHLESQLRATVVAMLRPLHALVVENPLVPGTPDVNTSVGWIELKHLNDWPRQERTIVRPEHFTQEQRDWLERRAAAAGRAWVLLRVGRALDAHWCLLEGAWAARCLGVTLTRQDLVTNHARGVCWRPPPTTMELIRCLTLGFPTC
jgi:hypothetical protein